MRRFVLLILALTWATATTAADPPVVDGVSGAPLVWSDWVSKRAPVAVLVWASWAPDAEKVIGRYPEFAEVSSKAGFHLVVLDVQETLDDGRAALAETGISWIHDRHGALLKQYRVINVPSVLIVAADGTVKQRLDATPEAMSTGRVR